MDAELESMTVRPLVTWWQRLRGLLGTDSTAGTVALMNCRSIHTFWMGYALDVAFVRSDGCVLKSIRGVPPWRMVSCRGASCVLERPSQEGPWPQEGSWMQWVAVTRCE
ncbi:MAG: DUF192 domain-containing protein [Atopobiaceae bacterium]|nr:DUF192 domain-containing protein [Atopobiaceae bacterium]